MDYQNAKKGIWLTEWKSQADSNSTEARISERRRTPDSGTYHRAKNLHHLILTKEQVVDISKQVFSAERRREIQKRI